MYEKLLSEIIQRLPPQQLVELASILIKEGNTISTSKVISETPISINPLTSSITLNEINDISTEAKTLAIIKNNFSAAELIKRPLDIRKSSVPRDLRTSAKLEKAINKKGGRPVKLTSWPCPPMFKQMTDSLVVETIQPQLKIPDEVPITINLNDIDQEINDRQEIDDAAIKTVFDKDKNKNLINHEINNTIESYALEI